ncbi:MAG TPA: PRC-barrel domain-containing protein [Gaiellaceae bacterium]|nr:PRC-barrel domain-containing protein [Gaiellaceae bacterium]
MLETYAIERLQALVGHEVVDTAGESVGYVDLVFVDDETGTPEWLGVWNGVWDTQPRVLVPLASVEEMGDELRIPWSKDVVRQAPSYDEDDDRGLFDDEAVIGISPEKEEAAHEHYGLERSSTSMSAARLRAWDHPERAGNRA